MGLDMYIYKRNGENDDVELAYFRKFNALHYYILALTDTHMDSNCEEIDLTLDQLNNVLLTLKNVEGILKNGKLDEDGIYDDVTTNMVMKIFPTVSGFFWGGTAIDEFFSYHIEDGIEQIQYVIHEVERGAEVYYYCWW